MIRFSLKFLWGKISRSWTKIVAYFWFRTEQIVSISIHAISISVGTFLDTIKLSWYNTKMQNIWKETSLSPKETPLNPIRLICVFPWQDMPVGIYLFKAYSGNTKTTFEISSKLAIKTAERNNLSHFGVFIANLKQIWYIVLTQV